MLLKLVENWQETTLKKDEFYSLPFIVVIEFECCCKLKFVNIFDLE